MTDALSLWLLTSAWLAIMGAAFVWFALNGDRAGAVFAAALAVCVLIARLTV